MDLKKISREDWIVAGLALLLAIDLLFLPWISASFDLGLGVHATASNTATDAPSGWLGVIGVLAAVALIAQLGAERLSSARMPAVGGSHAMTRLVLAVVAAACVALKFLFHVDTTTTYWAFGFWAAVALAAALVVTTARAHEADAGLTMRPAAGLRS